MQSGWLEEGGGGGHWSFKLIAALFQISVTGVNSINLLTKTLSPTVFSNCSCLVISNKADLSSVWTRPTSKKYSFWDYLSIVSPLIEFGYDRGEEEKNTRKICPYSWNTSWLWGDIQNCRKMHHILICILLITIQNFSTIVNLVLTTELKT